MTVQELKDTGSRIHVLNFEEYRMCDMWTLRAAELRYRLSWLIDLPYSLSALTTIIQGLIQMNLQMK